MHLILFNLFEKEYGVDIKNISRVIRMKAVIPVPEAPNFVEGVINFHGKVVPLINLRKKMGMKDAGSKEWNRILILQIGEHLVGALVDKVTDVINIDDANIAPPEDVLKEVEYLIGVAKLDERLILVINIEKMLTGEDRKNISTVHEKIEIKKK